MDDTWSPMSNAAGTLNVPDGASVALFSDTASLASSLHSRGSSLLVEAVVICFPTAKVVLSCGEHIAQNLCAVAILFALGVEIHICSIFQTAKHAESHGNSNPNSILKYK